MHIPLSPKHGVNPSLLICSWCMTESTGVALLGRLKPDDREAPHKMLDAPSRDSLGPPCTKCKVLSEKGIFIFESPTPRLSDRTGRYIVITRDACTRLFKPHLLISDILERGAALVPPDLFARLISSQPSDAPLPPTV